MPLLGPGMVSPHHLPIAPLGAEWGSGGGSSRKRRCGSIPEDEGERQLGAEGWGLHPSKAAPLL